MFFPINSLSDIKIVLYSFHYIFFFCKFAFDLLFSLWNQFFLELLRALEKFFYELIKNNNWTDS